MYNKLRSIILLAYEGLVCEATDLSYESRDKMEEDINSFIIASLRGYIDESEHFSECEAVRFDNILETMSSFGLYSPSKNIVTLDHNLRSFCAGAMVNDLKILSEAVNTMLHEHRHCHQFTKQMDIINHPLADRDNPEYKYELNPLEIDANEFANKYEMDAVAHLINDLEMWYDVKYVKDIFEEDIKETINNKVEAWLDSLPEDEPLSILEDNEIDLDAHGYWDDEKEEFIITPDQDIEDWFAEYEREFGEW